MNNSGSNPQTAEFSRLIVVDKIKSLGLREKIKANPDERQALVKRLGIAELHEIEFACELRPWKKGGARLSGTMIAEIEEVCVISLEQFKTLVEESVERIFTHPTKSNPGQSVVDLESLGEETPDYIVDGTINIGEVAVEALALTLASHPRKPGVVFSDHLEAAMPQKQSQAKKNPFEVLKNLKSD